MQYIIPAHVPAVVVVVSTTPAAFTPLQSSNAVTVAAAGTLLQSAAAFAGTPVNTGPCVSVTVISCVALVALPQLSVAVHVRCSI